MQECVPGQGIIRKAKSAHIIGRKTGSGQRSRANLAYNFPREDAALHAIFYAL
jgi:hypothetical protein